MAGIVVNGEPRDLEGVPLHTNALDFLRGCGLTGAKEGCAEGECGACSVLVARPAPDGSEATEWTAINSCLVPPRRSTARRSSLPRASARRRRCTPCSTKWPSAAGRSAATAHPASCAAWPPSSTAPAGLRPTGPGRHARVRGRQRFRPARDQRQPVPLHRLPTDQGRGVRARLPDRGRRARRPAQRRRPPGPLPPTWTTVRRRSCVLATLAEALVAAARPPRRGRGRRQHRLGRRGQPQGRARGRRGRRRPAARSCAASPSSTPGDERSGSARRSP